MAKWYEWWKHFRKNTKSGGGTLLEQNIYKVIAVKTIILSVFGLFALPFLAVIMQYFDATVGFSPGGGYFTDFRVYIFKSPLIYILFILCVFIILGIVFLVYSGKRKEDVK